LRAGLRQPGRWEPVDIEEMRRVVAEELDRALAQHLSTPPTAPGPPPDTGDAEAQFGAKLDRMLGGLMTPRPNNSPD